MMAFHIGVFVGSLVLPQICKCLKKSKYVLLFCGIVESGILYAIFGLGNRLSFIAVLSLFGTFGIFTRPNIAIAYPLLHTYYEPELAGTATGIANFCTSFTTSISIQISSSIIAHYGHTDSTSGHVYTWKGYQYGLWLIHSIEGTLAILFAIFIKDGDSQCCKKKRQKLESAMESTEGTLTAPLIV